MQKDRGLRAAKNHPGVPGRKGRQNPAFCSRSNNEGCRNLKSRPAEIPRVDKAGVNDMIFTLPALGPAVANVKSRV